MGNACSKIIKQIAIGMILVMPCTGDSYIHHISKCWVQHLCNDAVLLFQQVIGGQQLVKALTQLHAQLTR